MVRLSSTARSTSGSSLPSIENPFSVRPKMARRPDVELREREGGTVLELTRGGGATRNQSAGILTLRLCNFWVWEKPQESRQIPG